MSRPPNPLDRFRSYSYHHVLLVSDTTEAFRVFSDPSLSNEKEQSLYSKMEIGRKLTVEDSKNSSFYLLCDTRKVSYFTINDVSYETAISVGSNRYSNMIVSEVKVGITDAFGIAFLNYLDFIKNDMKVSLYKATYLLKTIFIGHTADGTTETIYQTAIPMMLNKLNVVPSHAGGQVSATFTPLNQGAAVLNSSQFDQMYDISGIRSETKRLKDAVKSLENELNEKSRQWFRKVQINRSDALEKSGSSTDTNYGKLVQYMFTVPENWSQFEVQGVYSDASESKFKKDGKDGNYKEPVTTKGVYIGFNASNANTIKSALETILKQSNDVNKLASNDQRKNGNVQKYEIVSAITSDDDTVTIHFDIIHFSIPQKVKPASENKESQAQSASPDLFLLPDKSNVMEFDYIFSGKNTDIMSLAIQLNDVQLFLSDNIFIANKQSQESSKDQKDNPNDDTPTKSKEVIAKFQEKDPVLPPAKSESQQYNMPWLVETDGKNDYVKNRQQFINNLAAAAGQASTNLAFKIRGNPSLYSSFTKATVFPHVKVIDNSDIKNVSYVKKDDKFLKGINGEYFNQSDVSAYHDALKEYVKEYGTEMMLQETSTPSLVPFYVKVNIFGQEISPDQLPTATPFNIPYTKMFYQGHYLVQKITHTFNNGDFHQDLVVGSILEDLYGNKEK